MLLLLIVGDMVGAGIYALVGEVGGRVGGAIWASFLLARCSRCSRLGGGRREMDTGVLQAVEHPEDDRG